MPAMLSFILECETSTSGTKARFALRMRVSMSEIGSVISLPTGFGHAGNKTRQRHFAEGQARTAEFPDERVTATADRAAINHAHRAGIARQSGERRVVALRLELGSYRRVLLDRLRFFLVPLFPSCRGHRSPSFGKLHTHQF